MFHGTLMEHPLQGIWNPHRENLDRFEPAVMATRVHNLDGPRHPRRAPRKVVPPRQPATTEFVGAVGNGFSLLECWGPSEVWLTNADLVERCGLTKSTVSRLASVLVDLGYLSRERGRGRLRLTSAILKLGFGSAFSIPLMSEVHPGLQRLASELNVYAALGVRKFDRIQVLDNVVSPMHPDAVAMDVGGTLPICRSALGLAALSVLPSSEAPVFLEHLKKRYGARWISIERDLSRTRRQYQQMGYCTCISGPSRDVGGVAVPLAPAAFGEIYVIGCAVPASEFNSARVAREIAPEMQRAARTRTQRRFG